MPAKQASLARYIWPATHLGELVEYLARRARLTPQSTRLPQPPDSLLDADGPAIGQWIDNAAGSIGLEAEPVSVLYGELEQFLRSGGPAILRLKGQTEADQTAYIGLLSSEQKKCRFYALTCAYVGCA